MASDIKISQMPSASSLNGEELIPIVQEGSNKITTVSKIKEGMATTAQLANKVDKDGSKVLSDQNFTNELKNKLDGIAENANNYTHPTSSGNKHIPSGGSSGQVLMWNSDGTAVWKTYIVQQSTSSTLGGVKIGYTTSGRNYAVQLDASGMAYVNVPWVSYTNATTSAAGLMSNTDKSKLDTIQEGANNYTLPTAGTSIGGVKQGTAVEDATSADDVITTVNLLLASLRASGAIAQNAQPASLSMTTETVIEFTPPMIIEKDKLYSENGVVYVCTQSSKIPISNKLSDLVGYYVEINK